MYKKVSWILLAITLVVDPNLVCVGLELRLELVFGLELGLLLLWAWASAITLFLFLFVLYVLCHLSPKKYPFFSFCWASLLFLPSSPSPFPTIWIVPLSEASINCPSIHQIISFPFLRVEGLMWNISPNTFRIAFYDNLLGLYFYDDLLGCLSDLKNGWLI